MISVDDLIDLIKSVTQEDSHIESDSFLVGADSSIDSMSSLNSIFKTPESLAAEFNRQLSESKK